MDGGVKSNSWLIIFLSIFQVNDFGWMFFIKMKINLIETILFECVYFDLPTSAESLVNVGHP